MVEYILATASIMLALFAMWYAWDSRRSSERVNTETRNMLNEVNRKTDTLVGTVEFQQKEMWEIVKEQARRPPTNALEDLASMMQTFQEVERNKPK